MNCNPHNGKKKNETAEETLESTERVEMTMHLVSPKKSGTRNAFDVKLFLH